MLPLFCRTCSSFAWACSPAQNLRRGRSLKPEPDTQDEEVVVVLYAGGRGLGFLCCAVGRICQEMLHRPKLRPHSTAKLFSLNQ